MSLLKARLVCEAQNVFSLQIVHIQWEIFAVLNPLGEKKKIHLKSAKRHIQVIGSKG